MPKIFFYQHQNMELFVENGNPRGGAVVQTLVWMQAFRDLGFEVFQAKFENDHRSLLPQFAWVKPISIYHPKKNKKRLTWFTHRFPSIYRALKNSKCDYLYVSIPSWTTFFIGLMCKSLEIKKIIRVANDNIFDGRIYVDHKKIEAFFINQSLRLSELTLSQNEFQYQSLKIKFPHSSVYKIFNPIVIDKNFLISKGFSKQGFIAWVANFRYQKNMSLLFLIACKFPKIKFKVAGEEKYPLDKETGESLILLKKLPNVEFIGFLERNEILPFLSKANFLLNTSRYEGFSNTFLEAMLTGTPILTKKNVNPDGIINIHDLGYIYENEDDLSLILNNMSQDEYFVKSSNCINFVKKNHDHLALGKRLVKLISENKS